MNLHKGGCEVSPERRFYVLEVAMQTTIKTLHSKGYNITQISRLVQTDRKTIRKILQSQERGEEQVVKQPHPSDLDEYREFSLRFSWGAHRSAYLPGPRSQLPVPRKLFLCTRLRPQAQTLGSQSLHGATCSLR
jgi:hypothetical protein